MTDQLDLLSILDAPGRARHSNPDTSKHAAIRVKTGALKHRILQALADHPDGLNDFQLWRRCDPWGRIHSTATRRGELEALGLVERTSRTAPTDTPSNEGLIHVLTDEGRKVLEAVTS